MYLYSTALSITEVPISKPIAIHYKQKKQFILICSDGAVLSKSTLSDFGWFLKFPTKRKTSSLKHFSKI